MLVLLVALVSLVGVGVGDAAVCFCGVLSCLLKSV